jgi:hypothetical protein
MAFHVLEGDYRAFVHEPDYDALPWKDSFVDASGTTSSIGSAGS